MSAKSIFRTHLTKYQFLFNIIDGCIEMKYIKRYHTKLHPRAILLYPSLQLKYKMRRRYKYLIYKKHKKQRKRVNIVYFKTILMQQPHTIF